MKKDQHLRQRKLIVAGLFLISVLALLVPRSGLSSTDRITADELVARHLEAIGPAQSRGAVTTRIISGGSHVVFRTPPPGQATGRAVLASDGLKTLIAMSFPSPVYRREQFSFDGKNFAAGFITPGVRSSLGSFLMTHNVVAKEGLMGGTLSSAWPLLDVRGRGPHLEYAGVKKVGSQTLHEIKYLVRGGSDLKVSLFFDQETFQHVRTVYERVIAASVGDRSYTNVQERETRYKMIEEFSAFKIEGGLSLPHSYKINLSIDTTSGTFLADWEITLTDFTFNEPIDPQSFTVPS